MKLVEFSPGQHAIRTHAHKPGHVLRDEFVVAGDEFNRDSELREIGDCLGDAFFGPVEKRNESNEGTSRSSLLSRDDFSPSVRTATAITRIPCLLQSAYLSSSFAEVASSNSLPSDNRVHTSMT